VRLPGGDRAVRQPWRMACAWLVAACGPEPELPRTLAAVIPPERWDAVARMAETGFAAPLTTSMGRLFDAVAALCGLRSTVSYEGQAAIELEALADAAEPGAYALPLEDGPEGAFVLDARVTIREVLADLERGATPAVVSARFHRAVAGATARACARAAEAAGTDRAVLSGGVFQNRLLLEQTAAELRASGLSVLTPERVPPNDGGIAYGQAAIAAAASD
jgi:hydrogenase maturation protein HypF